MTLLPHQVRIEIQSRWRVLLLKVLRACDGFIVSSMLAFCILYSSFVYMVWWNWILVITVPGLIKIKLFAAYVIRLTVNMASFSDRSDNWGPRRGKRTFKEHLSSMIHSVGMWTVFLLTALGIKLYVQYS